MIDSTGGEPLCAIYHDGRRVWPPSPVPADTNTMTIDNEPRPPEPPRLNRHERRRARKLARTKR